MIAGGYSGDHYLPAAKHPRSSSNLSPLATPFSYPLPSRTPPLPQFHQSSIPPPAAAAGGGFSSLTPSAPPAAGGGGHLRPKNSTGGVVFEPYYPHHYYPSSPAAAGVAGAMGDSFIHPSGYNETDAGSWNGSYDEELGQGNGIYSAATPPLMNSSWTFKAPNYPRGVAAEGHIIYDDDSHGAWRKKRHISTASKVHQGLENPEWLQDRQKSTYMPDLSSSYNMYAAAVPSASTSLEGLSYSELPRFDSGTKAYSSFGSNHDQYMVRPDSCFANPLVFYPSSPYPTYSHPHPPSNARGNIRMGQTLKTAYPIVHNVSPVTVDKAANSSSKEKEVKINKDSGIAYAAKYGEDHGFKKGVDASENFGEGLSSAGETSGKRYLDVSMEMNSFLKNKGLSITVAPGTNGSAEPAISIGSSEPHDQLNAIDSPCWKASLTSRQPLLPVSETVAIEDSIKESTDYNDLKEKKQDNENALNFSGPIQPEISSADESNANPSSKMRDLLINLSDLPQKSEDDNRDSHSAKGGNSDKVVLGCSKMEHVNKEFERKKEEPGQHDTGSKKFAALTETTPENKLLQADAMDDPKIGSSMLSEEKRLIKEVFRASVNLLCNDYNKGIKLEDYDLKLLFSAINNILLVLEDEKGFTRSGHYGGWLQSAWSPITNSKADGMNQRNIADSIRNIMHSLQFKNIGSSESENFVSRGGNEDHRKIDMAAQTFGNDIFKAVSGREENSKSQIYKDFWIRSEAEKCKLECDLQETRMKLEFANLKQQSEGKSALLMKSSSPRSGNGIDGRDTLLKKQLIISLSNQLSDKGERKDKSPSESLMAQKLHSPASEDLEVSEDLEASEDLEESVMARFNTLLKDQNKSWSMYELESFIGAAVPGPLVDGENDASMKDLGKYLADLGFTESISGSHPIDMQEAVSSTEIPGPNVHPHGAILIEQIDPVIDAPVMVDSEEFFFNPSLPYETKEQGQCHPLSLYRSSSSEWEEVHSY